MLLLGAVPHIAATLAATFTIGFAFAAIMVPAQTLIQRETPPDMLGRVGSTNASVIFLGQILGLAVSGVLAEIVGVRTVFFLCAALSVALARRADFCVPNARRENRRMVLAESVMSDEELKAELERLKAENERLKSQRGRSVSLKVSEKGGALGLRARTVSGHALQGAVAEAAGDDRRDSRVPQGARRGAEDESRVAAPAGVVGPLGIEPRTP